MYMKAIQVTLDDDLLARLDRDEEVQRDGRSAVLRRAAELYLRKRRASAIPHCAAPQPSSSTSFPATSPRTFSSSSGRLQTPHAA